MKIAHQMRGVEAKAFFLSIEDEFIAAVVNEKVGRNRVFTV